jgi:Ca-activated chloride channel family protein
MPKAPITITTRWDRPAVPIGSGETWLVVTIQTPKKTKMVKRSPVAVSFVIDRSGSMNGHPLELAKRGVSEAIGQLKMGDMFNVVAYDHAIWELAPLSNATQDFVSWMRRSLIEVTAGGSTDLFGGWQAGSRAVHRNPWDESSRTPRKVILLTDGHANVGITDSSQISQYVSRSRATGVITSTLGLGEGFDEEMLSGIAEAGGGNFSFARHAHDLPAFFARELGETLQVVATGASLTLTLPKGLRAKLLNPFPVERNGKQLEIALGDLPAGMKLDLVFSVTSRAKNEGGFDPFTLATAWTTVESGQAGSATGAIDPVYALARSDFEAMPRDSYASAAAAEMIAASAKREAMGKYRSGDRQGAQRILNDAQVFAAAAPSARMGLTREIAELQQLDPNAPDFNAQAKQVMNDEHRRSRGREL